MHNFSCPMTLPNDLHTSSHQPITHKKRQIMENQPNIEHFITNAKHNNPHKKKTNSVQYSAWNSSCYESSCTICIYVKIYNAFAHKDTSRHDIVPKVSFKRRLSMSFPRAHSRSVCATDIMFHPTRKKMKRH